MANNCVITFDQNEYGTYFTGQLLTGKVVLTLNKNKKFKGIKLQINGFAQCQWRERRGRNKPIYKSKLKGKRIYHGHEDYIASTTFLVGSENGPVLSIESGTHTYTFACPIPVNCPSSYEGTYGHIRYMVKVTCIRSGSSNRTYSKGFTVLKMLDLNRESMLLKTSASNESFENFCYFFNQAVTLRVDIMQTGYVPGQMILVSSHINNETSADVKNILITLNLRATYISDIPCMRTTSENHCLIKKYCGPVSRHTSRDYAEVIRVPATPPTCDHLSKIVRVSYEICVEAIMNHFMRNPKTTIPITIGNVPLITTNGATAPAIDDVPTTSSCAMQRANGDDHNLLSEETEVDFGLPPPTYEEAMFMTTTLGDNNDENTVSESTQFTPRYPVYDVDSMAINSMAQSPPPNPPPKKRKRKKKANQQQVTDFEKEKPPIESPIEI